MKRILITGSLGLVGSACMEHFAAKGWHVEGVDNNGRSEFFGTPLQKGNHHAVDIRNEIAVNELMDRIRPDAIIHAAAQPSHDYATEHVIEDFDINARSTVVLLEATRQYCPEATFVFLSTDKVYGENMKVPLVEEKNRFVPESFLGEEFWLKVSDEGFTEELGLDFAGDRSFFGCSKAAADMYAQQYAARGMMVGVFRPGCITGKKHQGSEYHGFLSYLAKCMKDGKSIYTIHGNGKQVRDQIHASDVANVFWHFIQNPRREVYNIGGGPERSVSVLEAIKLFSVELGWDSYGLMGQPAMFKQGEPRPGDRLYDVHDVSKFRSHYPKWDYTYSLSDIIKELAA